jgi:Rod binding domain-containing protein
MILESNYVQIDQYKNKGIGNKDIQNLKDDSLKKVCDDFESFFAQQLMDISLKSTKVAGEGTGADIIKGMYTETVSSNANGSMGISDLLYSFLSENNKK